jgi:asparagine N-glycosylation enzyme membrane subunit Stt3
MLPTGYENLSQQHNQIIPMKKEKDPHPVRPRICLGMLQIICGLVCITLTSLLEFNHILNYDGYGVLISACPIVAGILQIASANRNLLYMVAAYIALSIISAVFILIIFLVSFRIVLELGHNYYYTNYLHTPTFTVMVLLSIFSATEFVAAILSSRRGYKSCGVSQTRSIMGSNNEHGLKYYAMH